MLKLREVGRLLVATGAVAVGGVVGVVVVVGGVVAVVVVVRKRATNPALYGWGVWGERPRSTQRPASDSPPSGPRLAD